MKPEIKAKWVEALRSGKYKQTQRRLQFKNGYCCLGVLCDISNAGIWIGNDFKMGARAVHRVNLPTALMQLVGIQPSIEDKLAAMNDTGSSFAEIADWIEGHL